MERGERERENNGKRGREEDEVVIGKKGRGENKRRRG